MTGPVPNPAGAAGCTFRLRLREEAEVTVDIYDARGLRVAGASLGTVPAADLTDDGPTWRWREDTTSGGLATGAYWFVFRAGPHRVARRLTILH